MNEVIASQPRGSKLSEFCSLLQAPLLRAVTAIHRLRESRSKSAGVSQRQCVYAAP